MHEPVSLFQPTALQQVTGGDPALFAELLEIFLRTVPAASARLRQAALHLQVSVIAIQAHEMRSSLAMVGAVDTSLWCERLERAARRGSDPALRTEGEALCAQLDRLIAQVREYATHYDAAGAAKGHDHA